MQSLLIIPLFVFPFIFSELQSVRLLFERQRVAVLLGSGAADLQRDYDEVRLTQFNLRSS